MDILTVTALQEVVPKGLRTKVDQQLVDKINNINMDAEVRTYYQENVLALTSVIEGSKWSVDQYLDAVRYITYKAMGNKNVEAYARTFPDKFKKFKADGVTDKTISRYVSAYNGSKLVQAVWDANSIPFYMINRDYRQRALNVQVTLMETAKSEMVRTTAAANVLAVLAPPKDSSVELTVGEQESTAMTDLKEAVTRLACMQAKQIAAGAVTVADIGAAKIIQGETF